MNDIHIGSLIRKKMAEQNITASQLATAIHCDRSNIYSIYSRKSMDIELLLAISKALDFDFIRTYYLEPENENPQLTITIQKQGNQLVVVSCKDS